MFKVSFFCISLNTSVVLRARSVSVTDTFLLLSEFSLDSIPFSPLSVQKYFFSDICSLNIKYFSC